MYAITILDSSMVRAIRSTTVLNEMERDGIRSQKCPGKVVDPVLALFFYMIRDSNDFSSEILADPPKQANVRSKVYSSLPWNMHEIHLGMLDRSHDQKSIQIQINTGPAVTAYVISAVQGYLSSPKWCGRDVCIITEALR